MGYRVFISCGQRTEEERKIGDNLQGLLTKSGHAPFFAAQAHSLDELANHIFGKLAMCEAYLAVLHPRGVVHYPDVKETEIRGSVWIHQELAILAYGRFLQNRPIPTCVLMEATIRREGVMDNLIVNPHLFQAKEEIYERVQEWMRDDLVKDPIRTAREHLFQQHTQNLDEGHWMLLLLCILHESKDGPADRDQVIRDFETLGGTRTAYAGVQNQLVVRGLLDGPHLVGRGPQQTIGIRPAWRDLVRAKLREKGELL